MSDISKNFLAIADFLIPAHGSMPAFSSACSWADAQASLDFRTDLKEAFQRALAKGAAEGAGDNVARLHADDPEAFNAVSTIAITTYYMSPRVRELIGYPGQENVSYDSKATQPYLTDGTLAKVIARGRKYRPTPGL